MDGHSRLAAGHPRRRPLRWLSAAAAAAALGGFVASAAGGFVGPSRWIGYAAVIGGFSIGTLLQIFGPLKPFNSGERVDEFDRALRARAYLFAFPWFALATVLGLMLLMYMMVMQWPREALMLSLAEFMMMLVALGSSLPTVYASWSVQWEKDPGQGIDSDES